MSFKAPIFVVSGASGSGKTTICREMARRYDWYYSISHTTRQRRAHETDGRDYYFVDVTTFQNMIAQNDFLEWAQVYDNYYGTSRRIIEDRLRAGQGVILDVDTQGAANIRKALPQCALVFIDTVDLHELEGRLRQRHTDSDQEIAKRMSCAWGEIAKKDQYDDVVINDTLDGAIARFDEIIFKHAGLKPMIS
jgi:guanylate kinase